MYKYRCNHTVHAHTGRADLEPIRSRINNNLIYRMFRPRRPLSTAYKTVDKVQFCMQLTKAYEAKTFCKSNCYQFCYVSAQDQFVLISSVAMSLYGMHTHRLEKRVVMHTHRYIGEGSHVHMYRRASTNTPATYLATRVGNLVEQRGRLWDHLGVPQSRQQVREHRGHLLLLLCWC